MPKYSIIIAIYNRLEEAKELLDSVEKFDFPFSDFELIFSDDGSNDGFTEYIDEYSKNSEIEIVYIKQQNQGPGAARNKAMEIAKGEYFIFVDSDCMIPKDWLSKIDYHLKNEYLDAFGGPDTFHPSFSPLLKAINYSMTSFIGTGGTRGGKNNIQKKFYPRSFNMGLHRKVFQNIGGMGSLRHGQDMDFSARIYKAGFKVGLIPNAFVYHKRRTSLKRFFKQIFNWGVARINLGRMHEGMLKPIHFLPALVVLGTIIFGISWSCLPYQKEMGLFFLGGILFISVFAFVQSLMMYKNLEAAFLSIITLFIQIYAYGIGLLYGLTQKGTAKGFTKNYYK